MVCSFVAGAVAVAVVAADENGGWASMLFPTLSFLLFYLVTWPAAWIAAVTGRHGLHKLVLIAASYVFYGFWSVKLAFVLFGCVVATWAAGSGAAAARDATTRRASAAAGIAANLAALGLFKYYGWFSQDLNALLMSLGIGRDLPLLEIILPIGISFFTLQGISYIVDLYRGDLDRPRSLLDVTFFVSFFPHLLAGPIVRAASFMPQLDRPPDPKRVFVGLGVVLIVWGVFKKVVIANLLAVDLVNKAFFDPRAYGTIDLAAALYGYAVQIYCDFSGYSDIAIGLAVLLGYRFQRNFNQPYRAASLSDFWRRWHMSLSSWMRDYLYIPLGGNRRGTARTYLNLMVTMLLAGLWHGAAWKFILWGGFHGGALALERAVGRDGGAREEKNAPRSLLQRWLAIAITFHVVCLGWILFRAESVAQAADVLAGLANWSKPPELLTAPLLALIALGISIQFTPADLLERIDRVYHQIPTWAVGAAVGTALVLIEAIGGDHVAPFIYFQF